MADAGLVFGSGPLSRVTALIYTLLVVEVLLLVTAGPGLVLLVFLDRDASNVPLVAACLVPAGPALSAAIYAVHRRSRDLADLHPAAAFWRGYRANARGALAIWAPWLAWMAIIATSLANFGAAGVPLWWAALLAVVGVAATLWAVNALVITSLFVFRVTDVAKLAARALTRFPGTALGTVCLLVVAGWVTSVVTEAVPVLLASLLCLALVRYSRPMITEIQERFTR